MANDLIAVYSTMGFLVTINMALCGYLWKALGRLQRDTVLALSDLQRDIARDREMQARNAVVIAEKMVTRDELRDVIRDQTTQLVREMEGRIGPMIKPRRFGDGHD